jgi:hypothetical protein
VAFNLSVITHKNHITGTIPTVLTPLTTNTANEAVRAAQTQKGTATPITPKIEDIARTLNHSLASIHAIHQNLQQTQNLFSPRVENEIRVSPRNLGIVPAVTEGGGASSASAVKEAKTNPQRAVLIPVNFQANNGQPQNPGSGPLAAPATLAQQNLKTFESVQTTGRPSPQSPRVVPVGGGTTLNPLAVNNANTANTDINRNPLPSPEPLLRDNGQVQASNPSLSSEHTDNQTRPLPVIPSAGSSSAGPVNVPPPAPVHPLPTNQRSALVPVPTVNLLDVIL